MSSLDLSRRNLALHGVKIFDEVTRLAQYGRDEINKIGGYYAFSKERKYGH
jgi:lysine decarboxylase